MVSSGAKLHRAAQTFVLPPHLLGLFCNDNSSCLWYEYSLLSRRVKRPKRKEPHQSFTFEITSSACEAIYLFIYFTCDVNMTSRSRSWHWWAATASAACMARLGEVADWRRSWPIWPTSLRACVHANGGHSEHILWLWIRFLSTSWTSCFTPHLMQWATF